MLILAPLSLQGALGAMFALMEAQPEAVRVAYRARHWACGVDILQLAAMAAAAAREAAAAAKSALSESGVSPPLGTAARLIADGRAASSWSDWSAQLMTNTDRVLYTSGTHEYHFAALPFLKALQNWIKMINIMYPFHTIQVMPPLTTHHHPYTGTQRRLQHSHTDSCGAWWCATSGRSGR